MKTLHITRLKPNPVGKDRNRGGAAPAQLGGEWVDIKNVGQMVVDLTGVDLYHLAYVPGHTQGQWAKVVSLVGDLYPGWTLRVHAGRRRDLSVLHSVDRAGAELHAFTGDDNYVWNNREGDTALLWMPSNRAEIDRASYDPAPFEGAELVRSGTKLVPAGIRVGIRV
jgi:hypothetical protein